MSALYARVAGPIHPRTGIPTNVLVLPEAVQPGLKLGSNFETGALPTLTSPGDLGPPTAPSTRQRRRSSSTTMQTADARASASTTAAGCWPSSTPFAARLDASARAGRHGPLPAAGVRRHHCAASSRPSTCPRKTRRPSRSTTPASCSAWKT